MVSIVFHSFLELTVFWIVFNWTSFCLKSYIFVHPIVWVACIRDWLRVRRVWLFVWRLDLRRRGIQIPPVRVKSQLVCPDLPSMLHDQIAVSRPLIWIRSSEHLGLEVADRFFALSYSLASVLRAIERRRPRDGSKSAWNVGARAELADELFDPA
jgi:hypothetical protein